MYKQRNINDPNSRQYQWITKCQFISNSLQLILNIIVQSSLNFIQSMNHLTSNYVSSDVLCPRCERVPQKTVKYGKAFYTHFCFDNCGKIYWSLQQCPACDHPQKTVFATQPKLGDLIECKHCSIKFHKFKCPLKQCFSVFYETQLPYKMGQKHSCKSCQHTYREVVCQCGERHLRKSHIIVYEGQHQDDCNVCKKPIVFTHCKSCEKVNYHPKRLSIGQNYSCNHCQATNVYIPCPTCGQSTSNTNFGYCKLFNCEYCKQEFEFSSCCHCSSDNYHLCKGPNHPMKLCSSNCMKNYFAIGCHKCLTQVQIQNYQPYEAREQNCPNCKTELKFYHCRSCNNFNHKDSKCSYQHCPKPTSVKSYSREAEQRARKAQQEKKRLESQKLNKDYTQRQCKVCFNAESIMVNTSCLHVMMCAKCHQYMQQTEHQKGKNRHLRLNDVPVPCPVCKKQGRYDKAIKYIYQ